MTRPIYRKVILDGEEKWMRGDTITEPPIDENVGIIVIGQEYENGPSYLSAEVHHRHTDLKNGYVLVNQLWKLRAPLTLIGLEDFIRETKKAFVRHNAKVKQ